MKLACIQLNSQEDWQKNIEQAVALTKEAAQNGAKLIALPENVLAMAPVTDNLFKMPLNEMREQYLQALQEIAKKHQSSILAGTLPFPVPEEQQRLFNRAHLITDKGIVSYDKIHLCDITLPDGASLKESLRYKSGDKLVVADTAVGKLGLTICYDLRFPHLFRALAKKGAEIIAVPSAFTKPTGEAHWHALLRARAIENGCYIIAPAQVGKHPGNRETFGHSLIIDPWGKVLADGAKEVGIIYGEFDPALLQAVRQKIPSLQHDRPILA